jgi:hypothetical protein
MRFMIVRKGDKNSEAGVPPNEKLLAAMAQYNDEMVKAGVMRASERLQSSSTGARVTFSGGNATVIDGPVAEAKGLVAGFTIIDVKSKEEAIAWVKRWPALDGEVEIEIREGGCPGGVPAVSQSKPYCSPSPDVTRFVVMLKADEKSETGVVAEEKRLAAMAKHNEASVQAGVMLAGEGLQPSSRGARVKFSGGKPAVIDGPFAEAKELVAGFWLIQVKSKEEAIEWVKAYPFPFADAEVEIRRVLEA